ncbi:thiamine diphosphokinase [Roseicitreum antarcticum]|uniref:Thiamine diphosphokinase n=1 Tax=Roseicitreum antarcticum TaxID=564137 RepID=A0A1H2SEV5_9RHOB|nr:thiamine diphosphokinase [Roseicitreum antarcticum]SDW30095.1 thiamine pyrophosphokinase [Roseicitreum antarcticum]
MTQIVQSNTGVTLIGGGETDAETLHDALRFAPEVVAADGGADVALRFGLRPRAVIGDFDSISAAAKAALPEGALFPIAEQDSTDFSKCLRSVAAPFILAVGFTGARLDHTLAAFNTLALHPGRRVIVLGGPDLCFLAPPALALNLAVGSRFSLFPMAAVSGHSRGLRWEIGGLRFAPDGISGTSNEVAAESVEVTFERPGMLVILPRVALPTVLDALRAAPGWE